MSEEQKSEKVGFQTHRDPKLDKYGDTLISARIDFETYWMAEEASHLVFGKRDMSAFTRMAVRREAMNVIGPKAYKEYVEKLAILQKRLKGQSALPKQ